MFNFGCVEFAASMLLSFASIYVAETEDDFMKQYVPSLAVVAALVVFKDARQFCPDGTPLISMTMAFSGAYGRGTETCFTEALVRVFCQLVGAAVVFAGFLLPNKTLFKYASIEFGFVSRGNLIVESSKDSMSLANRVLFEMFATSVECVAVPYALMPLLRVDSRDVVPSKATSLPPRRKDLWFAAVGLGLLHYILQRVCRTTMNPITTAMHAVAAGENDIVYLRLIGQTVGVAFACGWCSWFPPPVVTTEIDG
jgi:hypothetical protein